MLALGVFVSVSVNEVCVFGKSMQSLLLPFLANKQVETKVTLVLISAIWPVDRCLMSRNGNIFALVITKKTLLHVS